MILFFEISFFDTSLLRFSTTSLSFGFGDEVSDALLLVDSSFSGALVVDEVTASTFSIKGVDASTFSILSSLSTEEVDKVDELSFDDSTSFLSIDVSLLSDSDGFIFSFPFSSCIFSSHGW